MNTNQHGLHLSPVYIALFLLGFPVPVIPAQYYFDPAFLNDGSGKKVDLSQYEQADATPEGDYLVDIYINQQNAATDTISFKKDANGKVIPLLTPNLLKELGVAVSRVPTLKSLPPDKPVGDLSALIPSAQTKLDLSKLRLDLSIPQADMDVAIGGFVNPALWDDGIPAAMFNYNLNGSMSRMDGLGDQKVGKMQNLFGNMFGGLNAGPWRLRSSVSYSYSGDNYSDASTSAVNWQSTYLQRDVRSLRGELLLGEISTGSEVFDGIPLRGARLMSNDEMLPSSLRGFAPELTGIARTNAKVTVTQNGSLIYQTNVPPGPFRLTDVYQASSGGDLVLTITEEDGTVHSSSQTYATLPIMQRPGRIIYDVAVGRFDGGGYTDGSRKPVLAMGTLVWGLPNYVTLYGGLLGSNDYQSAALGTGVSLGMFGVMAVDATLARANLPGRGNANGVAYRARYSKSLLDTGTSLDVSTYRYASRDFYSFNDANTYGYRLNEGWAPWIGERQRSTWQIGLNQSLWSWGSLYLRGSRSDYWGSDRVINTASAGFSSSFKGIGYSVNFSMDQARDKNNNWPTNRQVSFNMSMPLSIFSSSERIKDIRTNYSLSNDSRGRTAQSMGISGSMLDNRISWSASQNWDNQGNGTSGNLGLGYSGSKISSGLNYGYSRNSKVLSASASGGMLIHRHGITFGKSVNGAMALVNAPGADGVYVMNAGAQANSQGEALVPYLQSYQKNVISLDPTTLPDGVDVTNNSVNVYPTKDAVVEAQFKTRIGRQALITLKHASGPIPFGAQVTLLSDDKQDSDNQSSGIVGDNGLVYMAGMPQNGTLQVTWGSNADQQCQVAYDLGPKPESKEAQTISGVAQLTQECR
ncbi:MAG: fimbrial biogenesis outer membrane usher protein [Enterobacteriaceae bacterium]|jgi:outer membrane usher protein|nr:fimbrial biogenesis outer membrane usher protein [Enterobacteriaceae bacterium]